MKQLSYLSLLLLLTACKHSSKQAPGNTGIDHSIDYKASTYRFFMGQTIDSIEKTVDMAHNYLADDGMVNDTGITHYMTVMEELIKLEEDNECLPALFITTDKKELTEFRCSIIFTPASRDSAGLVAFFSKIALLFNHLAIEENKKKLATRHRLDIPNAIYSEQFSIDTTGRTTDALFIYEKKRSTR